MIHNNGTGPLCPNRSQVRVHYTGYFEDGTVFDSSVKRGVPITLKIGVGEVIKCWDLGFLQLRKGQNATLVCPPDYAYGKEGRPPVIPKNSALRFEV